MEKNKLAEQETQFYPLDFDDATTLCAVCPPKIMENNPISTERIQAANVQDIETQMLRLLFCSD